MKFAPGKMIVNRHKPHSSRSRRESAGNDLAFVGIAADSGTMSQTCGYSYPMGMGGSLK